METGESTGRFAVFIRAEHEGHRHLFRNREILRSDARVDQRVEIGLRTLTLDGIGGVSLPRVITCGRQGRDLAAGGESHDADARRIHLPLFGAVADQADDALRIGHGIVHFVCGAGLACRCLPDRSWGTDGRRRAQSTRRLTRLSLAAAELRASVKGRADNDGSSTCVSSALGGSGNAPANIPAPASALSTLAV